MARIDEHEVFAGFIGEHINLSRLSEVSHSNGKGYGPYSDSDEYIIAHVEYYDQPEFIELFKLTPTLIEKWDYRGIDFSVYLYVRDGAITGGHVFKYIETSYSNHYRPTGYETEPTQQELRVVTRILTYITSEEETDAD